MNPAFISLIFFVIFNYLSPELYFHLTVENLPSTLALLTINLHLIASLIRMRFPIHLNIATLFITLLYLLAIFVSRRGVDRLHSEHVLYNNFYISIAFFIIVSNVINNLRELKIFLFVLSACAFMLAYQMVHYPVYNDGRASIDISSLVGDPNDTTMLFVYSLPFAVVLLLLCNKLLKAVLLYFIFTILLGIVEAQSRGGFLALAVSIAMLIKEIPGLKKKAAAYVIISGLAVLFILRYVPISYIWRMSEITDSSKDGTGSSQARKKNMLIGLEYAFTHPISDYGPGNNGYMIANKTGRINAEKNDVIFSGNNIHNIFLQAGADIGFIGMLLLIAFTASIYYYLSMSELFALQNKNKLRQDCPSSGLNANCYYKELILIAKALKISFVSFLVSSFFLPVTYRAYLYYIAGVSVALYKISYNTRLSGKAEPIVLEENNKVLEENNKVNEGELV